MSTRLEMLQAMTQKTGDPFAHYALAMEYRKLDRLDEALATFTDLRAREPDYLPMYLIAGQLLVQMDQSQQACEWLRAGIDVATMKADAKALSELKAALDSASS
ncbi:MAG TPA: tetratricopeptide repeat protein [Polyangiaceae bacterium]|nr:tetratricopeptide repeat protein [Polyangiaceae bacterium]